MGDAALFSVASKILSTIATMSIEHAYDNGCSIRNARKELDMLEGSIKVVQAVLLDAEKKQDSLVVVKLWIKRVRDVLYEADDLFDEVVTDDMFKKQIMKGHNKLLNKVRVSCSKLNPILSGYSIAKKVRVIRKSLDEISTDIDQLEPMIRQCEPPVSGASKEQVLGWSDYPNNVFGREEDKKRIFELLFNEPNNVEPDILSVIAIVGIGGMGKTTLAHLIYRHAEVEKKFRKRWFVCISDASDEIEVLRRIFRSVCNRNYSEYNNDQMQIKIRKETEGNENFLLVLDNVWGGNRDMWLELMSLLSNGSKGSKIIVTTRSLEVARAVGARERETHRLLGLSNDESWDLFKKIAFTPEQESDARWTVLGREIVKKCANVPLAIRSIGSLLYTKNTIQEWESFKDQELSKLDECNNESIMKTLKLSYEDLPSNLKHCFAYCSLFPKDFQFDVKKLIYFWIAQEYIKLDVHQIVEQVGYSYFMDLHRRSFFQEAKYNERGEVESCKMHDLVHDLAKLVSGEEICMLSKQLDQFRDSARHATIVYETDRSWENSARPLNIDRVRSVLIDIKYSGLSKLDKQLTKFKCLRTLSLRGLRFRNVSSSIGELKHLRYLDLSENPLEKLHNSMTKLLNLVYLNLGGCKLRALPDKFRRLINLRFLDIKGCQHLKHMPPKFEELTGLQYLSNFEIGKRSVGVQMSGLDALVGLMHQLRGELCITFHMETNDWSGDECWKLPVSPHTLRIMSYPGTRIPQWGNGKENLASLMLDGCSKVKHLPPISLLPNLECLYLYRFEELEYLEEENNSIGVASGSSTFFPCLETLELVAMPKLEGWRRNVAARPHEFPSISRIQIRSCPKLKPLPECPRLQSLYLSKDVDIQQLMSAVKSNTSSLEVITIELSNDITSFTDVSLASLRELTIRSCSTLTSLHLTSPRLKKISIRGCNGLMSFQVEALGSLLSLNIENCITLKDLQISNLKALEYLDISGCPELELWEKDEEIDWDSLPNLRELIVDSLPPSEKLPQSLRHRQALGELQLKT